MRALLSVLTDAWRLAAPYFNSDQKWRARLLLAAIIVLNLLLVGMDVVLSYWGRAFMNALQEKDWASFISLLFTYKVTDGLVLPGFCLVAAVYILVAVYRTYLNQWLQINWRRWMTTQFLDQWLGGRTYYRISLLAQDPGTEAAGTDNPDQRIADDLRDFVGETLSLGLDLMSNVVTLFSFIFILWSLSGPVTLLGLTIPGYMVWVALLYAVIGSVLTHLVGRSLVGLRFRQQRVEADFRYGMVRLRENAEGVALHNGEASEQAGLLGRFEIVAGNWWAIMKRTKLLNGLIAGYSQLAGVFPYLVAAPRYFFGPLTLGDLTQTAGAFSSVQGALSWFVTSYSALATWRATVARLTTFKQVMDAAQAATGQGLTIMTGGHADLRLDQVALTLPNGQGLMAPTDLTLQAGQSTVITGRSGSGKSTLFRAIAGIWPFGGGTVHLPAGSLMFLPQRPYLPLGTLRAVVCYTAPPAGHDDAAVRAALADAGLGHLLGHLDDDANWSQRLSGGEQQRLGLARVLLARPDWLFLDEATASLDPQAEADLYALLRRDLPGTSVVSIAHRPSVAEWHDRRLVFSRPGTAPGQLITAPPATGGR